VIEEADDDPGIRRALLPTKVALDLELELFVAPPVRTRPSIGIFPALWTCVIGVVSLPQVGVFSSICNGTFFHETGSFLYSAV
jgi:hypothetical protein